MRLPVATGWGAGPFSGPTCPRSLSTPSLCLSPSLCTWSMHSVCPSFALRSPSQHALALAKATQTLSSWPQTLLSTLKTPSLRPHTTPWQPWPWLETGWNSWNCFASHPMGRVFQQLEYWNQSFASIISLRIDLISAIAIFSRFTNSFSLSLSAVALTEMSANLAGNRIDVSNQDNAE